MRTVAIHQPNLFPWLGFFHKIRWSDAFLLLDDALVQKTRSSWSNRVKLARGADDGWFTVPLDRSYSGYVPLREQRFAEDQSWKNKLVRTVRSEYGHAPHVAPVLDLVTECLATPTDSLAVFNTLAVTKIMALLELETPVRSTSDFAVESAATERLIELVQRVDGTRYLCGQGALGYQQDELFEAAGIGVLHQQFVHPTYPRGKEFRPGLSILDALSWIGAKETRSLLETPPPGW